MQLLRTINLPFVYQPGTLGPTSGRPATATAQLLAPTTCISYTRRLVVPPGFAPDVPTQALRKAYGLITVF